MTAGPERDEDEAEELDIEDADEAELDTAEEDEPWLKPGGYKILQPAASIAHRKIIKRVNPFFSIKNP